MEIKLFSIHPHYQYRYRLCTIVQPGPVRDDVSWNLDLSTFVAFSAGRAQIDSFLEKISTEKYHWSDKSDICRPMTIPCCRSDDMGLFFVVGSLFCRRGVLCHWNITIRKRQCKYSDQLGHFLTSWKWRLSWHSFLGSWEKPTGCPQDWTTSNSTQPSSPHSWSAFSNTTRCRKLFTYYTLLPTKAIINTTQHNQNQNFALLP